MTDGTCEPAGPWAERDDRCGGGQCLVCGPHAPLAAILVEVLRVALHELAAQALEERQVGARKPLRIGHAQRIRVVKCARNHRSEMRLQCLHGLCIKRAEVHAELAIHALRFGEALVALTLGAEELEEALPSEDLSRSRSRGERLVFRHTVLDQRCVLARNLGVARRPRVRPVAREERREPRQRGRMVIRVDRAVERVTRKRAEVVRKAVRIDAFALDQSCVAVGCLFCRAAAVQQDDRAAALLEMNGHADAHDARPEDEHIASALHSRHRGIAQGAGVACPPGTLPVVRAFSARAERVVSTRPA